MYGEVNSVISEKVLKVSLRRAREVKSSTVLWSVGWGCPRAWSLSLVVVWAAGRSICYWGGWGLASAHKVRILSPGSQDPFNGAPVEVAEYPWWASVQLAVEEEPLSRCPGDDVCVISPGQILADVDSEEPEVAEAIHRRAIDGDGGVSFSLSVDFGPQSAPSFCWCGDGGCSSDTKMLGHWPPSRMGRYWNVKACVKLQIHCWSKALSVMATLHCEAQQTCQGAPDAKRDRLHQLLFKWLHHFLSVFVKMPIWFIAFNQFKHYSIRYSMFWCRFLKFGLCFFQRIKAWAGIMWTLSFHMFSSSFEVIHFPDLIAVRKKWSTFIRNYSNNIHKPLHASYIVATGLQLVGQ